MDVLRELSDDDDFLELVDIVMHPRAPQKYRNRPNQFEVWNDKEFRDRFRLSKQVARLVIDEIAESIRSESDRNHALTAEEMVLLTLRFLASGSFLQVAGDIIGVDKSTASRAIYKVIVAIARLKHNYINMPVGNDQVTDLKQSFFEISSFPRCIGAIDCTHIKIQSPGGDDAEVFRNRKSFFAINTQVICDTKLTIRNIVCRWPGASHDSNIFRNSNIKVRFENGEFGNSLLLGDSGYAVKSYLLTPLPNPQRPAEHLYNESQIRTRNVVERCFGVWKRRFPILALGIRLDIKKVEAVIVATAVLHNIACGMNDVEPAVNIDVEAAIYLHNNINEYANNGAGNGHVRQLLINEYFQGLL